MSDVIEWVIEMQIQHGQAETVQPLVDEMVSATKANDPGTLHYEYYLNADRTRCTVLERYADSAAAMQHLANFGERFAARFQAVFAPTRVTVYGPADDAVRAALAGLGATHETRIGGFAR